VPYIGNSGSSVVLRGQGVVKWVGSKQYVIDFLILDSEWNDECIDFHCWEKITKKSSG